MTTTPRPSSARGIWRWLAVGALGATVALAPAARAQQPQPAGTGTVSGRVSDASGGTPIAAVQIQIVGTQLGTQTNQGGEFTIRGVPAGTHVLRALRVGFGEQRDTVTVAAGQTVTADIRMRAVAVTLNPVVTTATGEQRRVEVANAISNIDAAKAVETRPVASIGDLLTARAPGVQVLPNNSTGTGSRVRIRGTSSLSLSNDPIYVIDGVRMQSSSDNTTIGVGGSTPSRVGDINPEEIESIEVVKGPSAATLYGTDAANGVIVIKTKRGVAGRPQWTFYTEQALIKDQNEWPTNYAGMGVLPNQPAASQSTNRCFATRQGLAPTAATYCNFESLAGFNPAETEATSPLGTGHRQQYGLQVRGGSENVRYFVHGEWEDETGLQILPSAERQRLAAASIPIRDIMERPNVYDRATLRANLNLTLPGNADLAFNTGYIASYFSQPNADNNAQGWGPTIVGGRGDVNPDNLSSAYGFYPLGAVYQEEWGQEVDRFIGSTNGNWRPTSWLSIRGNAGIDFTNIVDTNLCRFSDCTTGTTREGFKTDNRSRFYNYTFDLNGTGTFNLTDALVSRTTVGAQFFRDVFNRNGAFATQLPPGATTISAGAIPGASEATAESRTLGFFAQQELQFADRLFLTAAVRSDDNSAFGADFDAVYYPKLSVSWVLSEEPFLPRPDWLNQLRLRAAYGASGRQPGTTDAVQFFQSTTAILEGAETPGVVFQALGNTELKPERSAELEAGFDLTALDNRFTAEFTYYNKNSRDALVQRILPPSIGTGANSRFENLGEIRNSGFEWLATAYLIQRDNFGFDISVNGSHNSNEIVDLGDVPPIRGAQISQIEGYPLNAFWIKPIKSFSDADGDGIIDASEVVVGDTTEFFGYSQPRTEISVTGGLEFFQRRVRLSALVDHKGGHKVWNGTERYRCVSFNNCRDLYDPNTPLDKQARLVAARFVTNTTDAGYIEDASFIRLRELALNFDVPQRWAGALRADRVALNLAARNLAIWTDYTGIDPESNYGQGDVQNDFLTQPPATYYVLRVTLGF